MDLGDHASWVKFMIRDRGSNFTTAFDAVLADAEVRTVLCSIQTPRMNAITERWIGGCRRELLDRTLVWNQAHLRQLLRQYQAHRLCRTLLPNSSLTSRAASSPHGCGVPELGHRRADLGFYAARSYSLMRPPRTGRRWIRSWERSTGG